jgi:hypothetical protein
MEKFSSEKLVAPNSAPKRLQEKKKAPVKRFQPLNFKLSVDAIEKDPAGPKYVIRSVDPLVSNH